MQTLKSILETEYDYEVEIIKLSNYIVRETSITEERELGKTHSYTTLMNKIKGGDELRKKHGWACLVELAIQDIYLSRLVDKKGDLPEIVKIENLKTRRKCFIIDSIKNKEELHLLREVYKDIFYCFSVFSPQKEREQILNDKGLSKPEISLIINTDEFEDNEAGQNVRDTFVEGDFFVRISKENENILKEKIQRYLNLIFETEVITPYPHEIAMYEAKSAAGNSACLSRQVGAAITNDKGEIISRGWNDVPKYGGNLYKEGDSNDKRCKLNGYCSNDKTKDVLTEDIIKQITESSYLKEELFKNEIPSHEILEKLSLIIRKSSKVKDLIEFSRSVHAEMHAIIIGSQLAGNKMIGGKLYCTTYPCHNCARHIIVAGIKEIYYIEPYKKSLCLDLHSDAITDDEGVTDKVRLLVYDGVAPRRYLEFFSMKGSRKDNKGNIKRDSKKLVVPKSSITLQALPTLEQQAIHSLKETGLIKDGKED